MGEEQSRRDALQAETASTAPSPTTPSPTPDRRVLVSAGLAGATAVGAATAVLLRRGDTPAPHSSLTPAQATRTSSVASSFALPKNLDPALLVSRSTYGRTADLEDRLDRLGPTKWLVEQLNPATVADAPGDRIATLFPRLAWSPTTVRANLTTGKGDLMNDLVAAHVGRAVWSERQLLEVMVDFWSNHLNITCPSSDVWDTRHRYDADVIRAHALGSFEEMLLASAFHPSMLRYLNGDGSTGGAPNENYARELLELHTVGVNGGYREKDVQAAALLLTGWRVGGGVATFTPARHHTGPLKVMGFTTANAAGGGTQAQQAYLRYLARHPRTAAHLAEKLAVRFVSDDPPAGLVKRLAARYRAAGTHIVPVLLDLFSSREFAASGGRKLRRPFEHIVAAARALGAQPGEGSAGLADLYYAVKKAGHAPLGWAPPNGYPDVAGAWQSPAAALTVLNAGANLVHGWWPKTLELSGPGGLLADPPRTRAATIDAVARKIFGRKASARERRAAGELLATTKLPATFTPGTYQQTETAALVASLFLYSPGHQLR